MATSDYTPVQLPLFPHEKRCTVCGQTLALASYYADSRATDGRQSACKRCACKRTMAWASKHRDVLASAPERNAGPRYETRACSFCHETFAVRAGQRRGQTYCRRACYLAAHRVPDATAHRNTLYRHRRAAGLTRPLTAHTVNTSFFLDWSDNLAWLVGLIWSDGNLYRNTVSVVSKDHDLLLTAAELIGLSCQPERKEEHVWRIRWTCRPVTERLRAIGLTPNKSFTVAWPLMPAHCGAAFVRGLLDGDGMVSLTQTRKGQQAPDLRVAWFSASPALRDALAAWLTQHDIRCRVNRSHSTVWAVSVCAHAALRRLHGLLYPRADLPCLARKRQPFERWLVTPRFQGGVPGHPARS